MRRSSLVLAPFLVFLVAEPSAAQRKMSIDDMMEMKSVGGGIISPDGRRIVYTVGGWEHPQARDTSKGERHETRSHLWIVNADGSDARQITFGERGESSPTWSPDGRYLAFTTSRTTLTESTPRTQIWLMRADGGESWQLTTAKEGAGSYVWSRDGKRIAYLMVEPQTAEEEAKIRRRDDPQ